MLSHLSIVWIAAALMSGLNWTAHAAEVDCIRILVPELSGKQEEDRSVLSIFPQDVGTQALIRSLRQELKASGQLKPVVKMSDRMAEFRRQYLPAVKADKNFREAIVRAMESELRMQSSVLKQKLAEESRKLGQIPYDAVILGTGVHGVLALQALMAERPNARVLVIENTDTAGSTFRYAGDVFNINSSNRSSGSGRKPLPGQGNINELPGLPIQVSDLSANKYPTAGDLGAALVIGLYSAAKAYPNVDVLLSSDVTAISTNRKEPGPVIVKAKFQNGPQTRSTSIEIETERTIIATGLGKPSLPPGVESAIAEQPELTASAEPRKRLPAVMTFEDVIRLAAQSNNPRQFFAKKSVAVVGVGDSANVFIEFLLGYASPSGYGLSDAQTEGPKRIYWVGQKIETCEAYIAQSRSRYAQIGTGYRSSDPNTDPVLEAVPPKLRGLRAGGRKAVELELEANFGRSNTLDADLVVVATGFKGGLAGVLRGYFPGSSRKDPDAKFLEDNFNFLERPTSISKDPTRVARGDKPGRGKPRVLIVGPAAGQLPTQDELVGIIQNSVSIFNNAPRTVAAAQYAAGGISQTNAAPKLESAAIAIVAGSASSYAITELSETRTLGTASVAFLQGVLASLARGLTSDPRLGNVLELEFSYDRGRDQILVRSPTGYNVRPVVVALAQSREFFNSMTEILRQNGEGVGFTTRIQMQNGRAVAQSVTLEFGKTAPVGRTRVDEVIPNETVPIRGAQR